MIYLIPNQSVPRHRRRRHASHKVKQNDEKAISKIVAHVRSCLLDTRSTGTMHDSYVGSIHLTGTDVNPQAFLGNGLLLNACLREPIKLFSSKTRGLWCNLFADVFSTLPPAQGTTDMLNFQKSPRLPIPTSTVLYFKCDAHTQTYTHSDAILLSSPQIMDPGRCILLST